MELESLSLMNMANANGSYAVNGSYAPGTIIDLEKRRVRVFGPTLVVVFENGKKVDERNYQ